MYRHRLAGVVVGSKFIEDEVYEGIDSGNRLELYSTEDRALEGFREGLLNLLCTC